MTALHIAALRARGASQLDPVHWHYVETLALRAQTQAAQVQRLLEAKVERLLADFEKRLDTAQAPVSDHAAPPAKADSASLLELSRYLQHHALGHEGQTGLAQDTAAQATPGMRNELKSVRQARSTWSKLSADKQLAQALDLAPKNAGPINSHMVVLRSLRLMRETSPDYLNRFMSYVDTLLCLEQSEMERPLAPKVRAPRAR